MRRLAAWFVAGTAVLASTLVLWGVGRPDLALGVFACVAFVIGACNLVDVMRDALPTRPSAVVVLTLVTVGMVAMAYANPEVWPLFAIGYPSLASVVVEAWLKLRDAIARSVQPEPRKRPAAQERTLTARRSARGTRRRVQPDIRTL